MFDTIVINHEIISMKLHFLKYLFLASYTATVIFIG